MASHHTHSAKPGSACDTAHASTPAHAAIAQAPARPVSEALALADAFCRERGERLTPIRRKVFELLLETGRATKAYTLLDQMRAVHPGSAPPTVYRALDFLLEMGLIHKIESINAFSACHDVTHCRHGMLLVCQRCGAVAEVHDDAIETALAARIASTGYALAGDAVEIKGLCPACRTAEPA